MISIQHRINRKRKFKSYKLIRYSTCWEDPLLIKKGLDIKKNDVILTLTSGGCNVLNFLLEDPKKVIAFDYSPRQNYLLKLKIQAIKNLKYQDFLKFLGIVDSTDRIELYNLVRENLDKESILFWDSNLGLINQGITYNGVEEKYLRKIGDCLRFFYGKRKIMELFNFDSIEKQKGYFNQEINSIPWRLLCKFSHSKSIMNLRLVISMIIFRLIPLTGVKRSRDEIQLDLELSRNLANLEKNFSRLFTSILMKNNYFASHMILGYYLNHNCYPNYLKKESFNLLKNRIDRIKIYSSSIQKLLSNIEQGTVSKINASNVFDWISNKNFYDCLIGIEKTIENNGRFCYFSVRKDRDLPLKSKEIKPHPKLAESLIKEDRTASYNKMIIGQVRK